MSVATSSVENENDLYADFEEKPADSATDLEDDEEDVIEEEVAMTAAPRTPMTAAQREAVAASPPQTADDATTTTSTTTTTAAAATTTTTTTTTTTSPPTSPASAVSAALVQDATDAAVLLQQLEKHFQPGEALLHLLHSTTLVKGAAPARRVGVLAITNYRFVFAADADRLIALSVPLTDVLSLKQKQASPRMLTLTLRTKSALTALFHVPTAAAARKSPQNAIAAQCLSYVPRRVDALFAFATAHAATAALAADVAVRELARGWDWYDERAELLRVMRGAAAWRLTAANEAYKLCPTYPRTLAVPSAMSDDELARCAMFRSSRRLPVLAWLHASNHAALVRCSQPLAGFKKTRCFEDEKLLFSVRQMNEARADAIFVLDARPKANVMANTAMGGGIEQAEAYTAAQIEYLDVHNIHVVRDAYLKVMKLASTYGADDDDVDDGAWLTTLDGTGWLQHLRSVLRGAVRTVDVLQAGYSVVAHCSDGWDRTSQLTSLPMLLLDASYRTLRGFGVLIEKEWLAFGHKFAQRCGVGEYVDDRDQQSPIFVQFLDCVHQLVRQFPTAFEFNEALLVALAEETYSCRFGTFLYICDRQRRAANLQRTTRSFWSFVDAHRARFTNAFFKSHAEPLRPHVSMKRLRFWDAFFLRKLRAAPTTEAVLARAFNDEKEAAGAVWQQVDMLKQVIRSLDDENKELKKKK